MIGPACALALGMLQSSRPSIQFANQEIQTKLAVPFEKALENLLVLNTVPFDPAQYNSSGRMRGKVFFRAGGDYPQPWTRDAAVNSWNAGSLIAPEIARDTLWSVTVRDKDGTPSVQRDNQWWDKVIWILGAWNHYLVTGDREFLADSYGVAKKLLAEMKRERLNARFGLYQGPSFFNDGIAGYPAPPAESDDQGSSFVLDHAGSDQIMALSTNCLYVGAYRSASRMARELGQKEAEYEAEAKRLAGTINRRLWDAKRGAYAYFLRPDGSLDASQEGCGISFAVLFEVADKARAKEIMGKAHLEPFGITDVYPHFPRFSDEKPGRHNEIVWPVVQGFWARAAVHLRNMTVFAKETETLAGLSAKSPGGRFFEIYNAKTGVIDGGWQNGHRWSSVHDQTWSATAYLSMLLNGMAGLRFGSDGLRFEPMLPAGWGNVQIRNLRYRKCTLDLSLSGGGTKVKSMLVDGKTARLVAGGLVGRHEVAIVLTE